MTVTTAIITCLLVLLGSAALADIKLPAVIGDNMVLQQGMPVPIWGSADPGDKITVSIGDHKATATASDKGEWSVRLKSMHAGGPFEMTIAGKNTITLKNIMVGEVWVCSGQSNMQFELKDANNGKEEVAGATHPNLRLFSVKMQVSETPLPDTEGSWAECTPAVAEHFSATAYFFGRELEKKLGVTVGLIHTSWGGTPAEAWTPHDVLAGSPEFTPILDRWVQAVKDYPVAIKEHEKAVEQWQKDVEKAKAEGKPEPWWPWPPLGPGSSSTPAGLYNAMILPVIPYGIKGAIWYQGESNADRGYQYRKLFPAMIQSWRRDWKQGDFPFLFVQLANFGWPPAESTQWPELREAQLMTLKLKHTGMAVAIDIGDAGDIHPKNKQDAGKRLELAAEAVAYGRRIEYSGPIYRSMDIEGDAIHLRFNHVGGGLVARGGDLKGFTIAGEDKKFVPAVAKIDGDAVVVSASGVAKPVAVRYAWLSSPECNLYNKADLPASPFRTDTWPGMTVDAK